eukprot:scaffold24272_cov27-Tisochrysis_lutea.AAC.1
MSGEVVVVVAACVWLVPCAPTLPQKHTSQDCASFCCMVLMTFCAFCYVGWRPLFERELQVSCQVGACTGV